MSSELASNPHFQVLIFTPNQVDHQAVDVYLPNSVAIYRVVEEGTHLQCGQTFVEHISLDGDLPSYLLDLCQVFHR